MKKRIYLAAVLLVTAGLSACGSKSKQDSKNSSDSTSVIQINMESNNASSESSSSEETSSETTKDENEADRNNKVIGIGKAPGSDSEEEGTKDEEQNKNIESIETGETNRSENNSAETKNNLGVSNGTFETSDCSITINGIKLSIGDDFSPNIYKVGSNPEIVEGQACLEGGYDTNYYYGNELSVYTYAEGGKQIIYDIYITGSSYPTAKGAMIGETTRETVYEMYGEPARILPATDEYMVSGSQVMLSFEYNGDILESMDIIDTKVND